MDGGSVENDRTNGRWTKREHEQFLMGLHLYGKNWKKIETMVVTRNGSQIRSHAQKYFLKGAHKGERQRENEDPKDRENSHSEGSKKQKTSLRNTLELNSPDFWHELSSLTSLPEFCFWNLIDSRSGKQTAEYPNSKSFETFRKDDKVRCFLELTNLRQESGNTIRT